jgi:TolA-binding protein
MLAGIHQEAASILKHAAACLTTAGKHQKRPCLALCSSSGSKGTSSSGKDKGTGSSSVAVQQLQEGLRQQQQHLERLQQHLVAWRQVCLQQQQLRGLSSAQQQRRERSMECAGVLCSCLRALCHSLSLPRKICIFRMCQPLTNVQSCMHQPAVDHSNFCVCSLHAADHGLMPGHAES